MAIINKLTAIAEAIRSKTNTSEKLTLDEMPSAIEGIQSGGGVDWFKYVYTMKTVFYGVAFPEGSELSIALDNVANMTQAFQNATGVKKITLTTNESDKAIDMTTAFYGNDDSTLETIDLSGFKKKPSNMSQCFNGLKKLVSILGEMDFSETTNATNTFKYCSSLVDVEFKENTISVQVNFGSCSLLSDTSIQSIIDGLATVETAKTLTFHATVKAKLTEAQISQITSKNWTLA